MAINLQKGQRIDLSKNSGDSLRKFYIGCNWGAITEKKGGFFGFGAKNEVTSVDLDLSCIMLDANGKMIDHVYSPEYRRDFLAAHGMPDGKLQSADGALRHSGDDRSGDVGGDDNEDNEIITVDLDKLNPAVEQIYFFLNNVGQEDFAAIPYASIRMYEDDAARQVFAAYDVAAMPEYAGQRALIMGKLYRRCNVWRFAAIGEACADTHICATIERILRENAK